MHSLPVPGRHRYLDPYEKAALSLNRQTARRTAVIVAEYPIWLDALQLLLERLGVEVAGRAVREEEAIRLLEEHRPDMFLADFPAITDDVGSPLLARARA